MSLNRNNQTRLANALLTAVFVSSFALAAVAQEQYFESVSMNVAEGWKRSDIGDTTTFVRNAPNGEAVCQVMLFPSTAGNARHEIDFREEWADKVAKHFPAAKQPTPKSTSRENGENLSIGMEQINVRGKETLIILGVYRVLGQRLPMRALITTSLCEKEVYEMYGSIGTRSNDGLGTGSNTSGKNSSIVGTWGDGTTGHLATVGPQGTTTGRGGSNRTFTFKPDGTYEYNYLVDGVMSSTGIFIRETGTYSVRSDTLTLLVKTNLYRKNGLDTRSNPNEARAYQLRFEQSGKIPYLILTRDGFVDRLRRDGY